MSWLNLRKKKIEPSAPKRLAVQESAAPAPAPASRPVSAPHRTSGGRASADVLVRPHISERASDHSAKGVYVFEVRSKATKPAIRAAVESLYKVAVEKVRTVTVVPKRILFKGKPGISGGGKKAYVYLKEGQKIEVL